MEKRGATEGSFKGKKYYYIIKYIGGACMIAGKESAIKDE
jgi:hypothetical protein